MKRNVDRYQGDSVIEWQSLVRPGVVIICYTLIAVFTVIAIESENFVFMMFMGLSFIATTVFGTGWLIRRQWLWAKKAWLKRRQWQPIKRLLKFLCRNDRRRAMLKGINLQRELELIASNYHLDGVEPE